jgi:hypothetical protein
MIARNLPQNQSRCTVGIPADKAMTVTWSFWLKYWPTGYCKVGGLSRDNKWLRTYSFYFMGNGCIDLQGFHVGIKIVFVKPFGKFIAISTKRINS